MYRNNFIFKLSIDIHKRIQIVFPSEKIYIFNNGCYNSETSVN